MSGKRLEGLGQTDWSHVAGAARFEGCAVIFLIYERGYR